MDLVSSPKALYAYKIAFFMIFNDVLCDRHFAIDPQLCHREILLQITF